MSESDRKVREAIRTFKRGYTSTLTESEAAEAKLKGRRAEELAEAKTAKERNAIRRKYKAELERLRREGSAGSHGAVKREDEDDEAVSMPKRGRSGSDVPRWMHAGFDARDVSYAPIVLTSHPAKRRLSFTLDDTHYVAVIVLTGLRGEIVPLR